VFVPGQQTALGKIGDIRPLEVLIDVLRHDVSHRIKTKRRKKRWKDGWKRRGDDSSFFVE